jgi:hypothetical protein
VTDLDDRAAVRAVESLQAEIRRRERVLAEHGARDVEEAAGAPPRLVVIVDEFAALVAAHPEMHELFSDVAARGRALGIHDPGIPSARPARSAMGARQCAVADRTAPSTPQTRAP